MALFEPRAKAGSAPVEKGRQAVAHGERQVHTCSLGVVAAKEGDEGGELLMRGDRGSGDAAILR